MSSDWLRRDACCTQKLTSDNDLPLHGKSRHFAVLLGFLFACLSVLFLISPTEEISVAEMMLSNKTALSLI